MRLLRSAEPRWPFTLRAQSLIFGGSLAVIVPLASPDKAAGLGFRILYDQA